jgi:hypothetical protein
MVIYAITGNWMLPTKSFGPGVVRLGTLLLRIRKWPYVVIFDVRTDTY